LLEYRHLGGHFRNLSTQLKVLLFGLQEAIAESLVFAFDLTLFVFESFHFLSLPLSR
jgi:hypothetical protein